MIASGAATEAIGDPMTGPASHRLVVPFARGIYEPGGALAGITIVAVEADALKGFAATMGVTGRDTLTIFRSDGKVMARSDGEAVGQTIPPDNALLRAILEDRQSLTRVISPIDEVERIDASERLGQSGSAGRWPGSTGPAWPPDPGTRSNPAGRTEHHVADRLARRRRHVCLALAPARLRRGRRDGRPAEKRSAVSPIGRGNADLIRLIDRNGVVLYANPATRDLLGVDPEMLVGKPTGRFVHPDDRHAIRAHGLGRQRISRQAPAKSGWCAGWPHHPGSNDPGTHRWRPSA